MRSLLRQPSPVVAIASIFAAGCFTASAVAADIIVQKDEIYAAVDGKDLRLDLYLPTGIKSPPLVVWIHGGAWAQGSRLEVPMAFVRNGFATASIGFRQSTEARFPAQVHDIKAAIRFLRAKASDFGYRGDLIAITGASSGGHLAALIGVTNNHSSLEGRIGQHLNESSSVQAIVSYSGASNLTTVLAQSTPFGLSIRRPALERLLGDLPPQADELAKLASPVGHVDRTDPPLMLFHGDRDPQMPIEQAHELQKAYEKLGLDARLHIVQGAGHGGPVFFSGAQLDLALAFLKRVIGQ